MDPFRALPAELCLEIMFHIHSKRSISQLIQASPYMLAQFVGSKGYITRALLESDLDDIMVQDAMALLLFPKVDPPEDYGKRLVDHLDSWSKQQLPNPLKQHGHSSIRALDKLHSWLIAFVEDYLTKATSIYPPREYICLPNTDGLMFQGQIIGNTFDVADLSIAEIRRLLGAFLRYELICRGRHPPGQCYLSYQEEDQLHLRPHSGKRRRDAFYRYGGQPFRPWDWEALRCVHQYLGSLYAAIFAQCSGSWLPDIPSDALSVQPRGLLFPDNLFVDFNAYASDFDLWTGTGRRNSDPDPWTDTRWYGTMLDWHGFNLAGLLLRSMKTGRQGRDRVTEWLAASSQCGWCIVQAQSSRRGPADVRLGRGALDLSGEFFERAPGLYASLCPELDSSVSMQLKPFRQRAWAFLDNDRLYPSPDKVSVFPSPDEMKQLSHQTPVRDYDRFSGPWHARELRRSRKWHEEGGPSDGRRVDNGSDSNKLETKDETPFPFPLKHNWYRNLPDSWE